MPMKTDHSKVNVDSLSHVICLDSSEILTLGIIDSVFKFVDEIVAENENLISFDINNSDSSLTITIKYVNDEDDDVLEYDYKSKIVQKFKFLTPSKLG
ncbi:hypothetical protein [Photobacterium damselae]|uniref:hypothetical protein n=1 Tax=Photobacterium damselae TaxID=38293 RepID=UPI001F34C935|nr:hypothetical protein [Photobacterium damselae]UKA04458.1 hypothetical protein IHC89_22815 [Photobacterium damselae subsp. damselae]